MKFRQTILLLTAVSMIAALVACGGGSRTTPPPPTPVLADGTYVFSLAGQDTVSASDPFGGAYFVAGAFKVSGGKITGGEQDYVDFNLFTLTDPITSGSLTKITNGNIQITLHTADAAVGVGGTETLSATLVSATRALITEFDTSAGASGTLDLQTTTAPALGGYAFFVAGLDANAFPASIGGVINVDGAGTISGAGSVFDISDAGNQSLSQPVDASTVSAPDAFGRVQISLDLTTSGLGGIGFAGYVVDANHVHIVENNSDIFDANGFFGDTGGTATAQGGQTGTFNTASVAGSSFVFGAPGFEPIGYFQLAGVLTTNADGTTVSGTLNTNDFTGTGVQAPIPFTGTYTVDATGRVTLSNLTDGATFNFNAELYLDGNGDGTLITVDFGEIVGGLAFRQTGGGSFTAASFSGPYAFNATGIGFGSNYEFDAVGPVKADGTGALTGATDVNPVFSAPASRVPLAGDFVADPSGVFTTTAGIQGLDVTTSTNSNAFTYYLVDSTRVVTIETDPNQLTLGYFELTH
jgi:hypothetical protein